MWTCGNCSEAVEDQFDACWNCGCSRDGKLNLDFVREPQDKVDDPIARQFTESFLCPRCKHREVRCKRVAMRCQAWRGLPGNEGFLAVSCEECGFTELYSLSVLEGRSDLGNFLRGLFGT